MGSTKPKEIRYWGAWMGQGFGNIPPSVTTMGVTSFSRNPRSDLVMVHGTELPERKSYHRRIDGMTFYLDSKSMDNAVKRAMSVFHSHTASIVKLEQQLMELKRSRRLAVERELNRHAIEPSELEGL